MTIGIDLGATNIKGIVLNDNGTVTHHGSLPTNDDPDGSSPWKEGVKTLIRQLETQSKKKAKAIGLSAPGVAGPLNDRIAFMPGRMFGIEDFVWPEFLGMQTFVLNDGHAALLAEAKMGVGKGFDNIVMITLGTGVGGGILLKGELFQGWHQVAGHIGHMTVDGHKEHPRDGTNMVGSLEDAIGNLAVQKRSYGLYPNPKALVDDYRKGDAFASWLWLDALRSLALAIASLANVLSPQLVILAGGITHSGKDITEPLARFMDLYEWRPGGRQTPIKIAEHSDYAGAVGAAWFAKSKIKK